MAGNPMSLMLIKLAKHSALVVLAICVITASASPVNASARASSLRVAISIRPASLHCTADSGWCSFVANTLVQNTGVATTVITVWTQPGWSWVSDDAGITPDIDALKNAPSRIELEPGEKYSSLVDLGCLRRQSIQHVFKLGFLPNAERPASGLPGIKISRKIAWSNQADVPRACYVLPATSR